MKDFFKRDNYILGIGIAIIIPVAIYFLIQLISFIVMGQGGELFRKSTDQLLAICANLIPFRYYLLKLKADKTGRGIMLITFALAMVYFIINWSL